MFYFNEYYTQHGSGAGTLFVTPEGHTIPKSYRLVFPCNKSIVEYEALIIRIKVVIEWKIIELQVYGDSQLVINQVNVDYQKTDEKLIPHKRMVDEFKKYYVEIKFE